jgi:CRP-like cAMP-binding protein
MSDTLREPPAVTEGVDFRQTISRLASTHLFDALSQTSLRELASACREIGLGAGDVLMRQGEPGDCLYLVLDGRLKVTQSDASGADTLLGEAHAGEFVGEGALLERAPRMATVTAATAATLLELSRDALEGVLNRNASVQDSLRHMLEYRVRWARTRRLRPGRDELIAALSKSIGGLDAPALVSLENEVRWETLPRGAILMHQGDPGDSVYFVVSGRLRVFGRRDDGTDVEIAEVGPGEAIGEMALLSNEPRAASVDALRDTELLALSRAGFERLVNEHPKALAFFTRLVVARLNRTIRGRAPVAQLGTRSTVTLEDCDEVVRTQNLVLRNLKITQMYHRLSQELALMLGHADANWCTFACNASKTAGYSIRGEAFRPLAWLSLRKRAQPFKELGDQVRAAAGRGMIAVRLERIQDIVTETVSAGNLKVFAELAPIFATMIQTFHRDQQYDRDKLARFLAPLDRGPTEAGGQDTLVEALTHYYEAMFEQNLKGKAELMLLGNIKVGLHEQIRLQPNIVEALNAPLAVGLGDPLVRRVAAFVIRLLPRFLADALQRRRDALERTLLGWTASTWRRLVTRNLMTIKLPYGELWLGAEVPELPTATIFPDVLQTIDHPELQRVLARYDGRGDGQAPRAADWGVLDDRMRFIANLFRSRQKSLELFGQPFLYDQLQDIVADRVPTGEL